MLYLFIIIILFIYSKCKLCHCCLLVKCSEGKVVDNLCLVSWGMLVTERFAANDPVCDSTVLWVVSILSLSTKYIAR